MGDTTTVISGCLKCSDISSGGATKLIICMEDTSTDVNVFSKPNWAAHQKEAVRSGKDDSDDALAKILSNSEQWSKECLSLPIHSKLKVRQSYRVINEIIKFFNNI